MNCTELNLSASCPASPSRPSRPASRHPYRRPDDYASTGSPDAPSCGPDDYPDNCPCPGPACANSYPGPPACANSYPGPACCNSHQYTTSTGFDFDEHSRDHYLEPWLNSFPDIDVDRKTNDQCGCGIRV